MSVVVVEVESGLVLIHRDQIVSGKISRNKTVRYRDVRNDENEGIVKHFGEPNQCAAFIKQSTSGKNGPSIARLQLPPLPPRSRIKREPFSPTPDRSLRGNSVLSTRSIVSDVDFSENPSANDSSKLFVTPKSTGLAARRIQKEEQLRRVATPACSTPSTLTQSGEDEVIRDLIKQMKALRNEVAELREIEVTNQSMLEQLSVQQEQLLRNMPARPVNKYGGPQFLDNETLDRLTNSTTVDQTFMTSLMDHLFPAEPERSLPIQERDQMKVYFAREVYGNLRCATDEIARKDWAKYCTRYNEVVRKRLKRKQQRTSAPKQTATPQPQPSLTTDEQDGVEEDGESDIVNVDD